MDDLLTAPEVAEMLGIQVGTWRAYVARHQAPQPARRYGRTPVWDRGEVLAWHAVRPRPTKPSPVG